MGLRILTISKPYVASAYRHKLALWAQEPDVGAVGLICPPAWGSQVFEVDSARDEKLWIKRLPIVANGKNHFHFYRGLATAIEEFKPDILNVEEEHYSLVTAQAYRLAQRFKIPAAFYTWQNIDKKYPYPFSRIEKYIFEHSAYGFAGNHEAAVILRKKGYAGPLLEVPQMGVEVQRFAPQDSSPEARLQAKKALGLDPDKFWLGFAGRVVEEKGIQTIVEALAQMRASKNEFRILILGDGPYLNEIKSFAAREEVFNLFTFRAGVPSSQVAEFFRAVDILCLPSLTRANWKEQFGRVLIEAMAAEALLIGSSSGEIPIVIGDAGLVFGEGDGRDLALAMEALRINPDLRDQFRHRAYEKVRREYAQEVIANKFMNAFREIAKRKR